MKRIPCHILVATLLLLPPLFVACGENDRRLRRLGPSPSGNLLPEVSASSPPRIQTIVIRPADTILQGTGSATQLSATCWSANGEKMEAGPTTLQWSSDNTGVATIDNQGKVTTLSAGEALITVRLADKEAKARVVVEAIPPMVHLVSVAMEPSDFSLSLPHGQQQLTGSLTFSNQGVIPEVMKYFPAPLVGTIQWNSSDPSIAEVNEEGLVSAIAPGTTTITGIAAWRSDTVQDAIDVTVLSPVESSSSLPQPSTPSPSEPPQTTEVTEAPPPSPEAPYADVVVSYTVGQGGGFNQDRLPGIVLGPPHGGGLSQGSGDVVSLGNGGEIILEFTDYIVFDGAGVDFTVFENAFQIGSDPDNTFAEPGIVAVSNDGLNFTEFPCNATVRTYQGCAGVHPTLANPDHNAIDPTDPIVSGGDSFDLADVGLRTARFIRIRDSNSPHGPVGSNTAGFDLDAVAIVHGTLP